MYKEDLALNNLQWLICHKTKPNHTKVDVHRLQKTRVEQRSQYTGLVVNYHLFYGLMQ